jgi:hypothetical protein
MKKANDDDNDDDNDNEQNDGNDNEYLSSQYNDQLLW